MPKFVTALYASAEDAEAAIEALHDEGFEMPDIQHVDRKRVEEERFFERLFIDENGDGKTGPVRVMGIDRDEVDQIAEMVRQGHSLVIALSEEERADEARQILARFGAVDIEQEAPGRESAIHELTGKWFHVVELDEKDLSRGARAHAVHVHPRKNIRHIASDEMPGAHTSRRFKQLETDFRVHYEENFADSDYSFDDLALGYRYGMALAENRALFGREWAEIADHARRGWRDHTTDPWEHFGEAVHFAWRRVRAEQRRERRSGEEGRWTH